MRVFLKILIACALLAVLAAGFGVWYASSGRLAERVRARLIAEAERATGGRVEIGAFRFQWRDLKAEIDNAVLHGTEAAGAQPLFSAARILVRFRIVSLLERKVDLAGVDVNAPRMNVIVASDGSTNFPHPHADLHSGLQRILDLAIGRFDARNGILNTRVDGRTASQPWSAHGRNLAATLNYDANGPRYTGSIAFAPLEVDAEGLGAIEFDTNAQLAIDRNDIRITRAELRSNGSEIHLSNLTVRDFQSPVITSHYEARISLTEFAHQRGVIQSSGDFSFMSPARYSITGTAQANDVDAGPFRVSRFSAKVDAAPDRIELTGIQARVREGGFAGAAEIRNLREFSVRGRLEQFEARPLIEMIAHQKAPYDARISGPFEAGGDLAGLRRGRFIASAHVAAEPAACAGCIPVHGFIDARYDGYAKTLALGPSSIQLPSTRLALSGVLGRELSLKIETRNLDDFRPAVGEIRSIDLHGGEADFAGSATGPLDQAAVAGHINVSHAAINGEPIESFSGDIAASKTSVSVRNGRMMKGPLSASLSGSLGLIDWRPSGSSRVDATVQITGADARTLLGVAGEKNIQLSGSGTARGHVTGTLGEPEIDASLALAHGAVYSQPYDTLSVHVANAGGGAQMFNFSIASGVKRILGNGRFDHHAGAAPLTGTLTFRAQSNPMPLNQIALVRARQPDLHGMAQFHAQGSARVRRDEKGNLTFEVSTIDGDASLSGIELDGRNLGDARLTAETKENVMAVRFDSNAAKASIHGSASVQLERDYPMTANITFSRAGLNALAALAAKPHTFEHLNFDGTAAGELSVRGPLLEWPKLTGEMSIPELELFPATVGNCGDEATCNAIRNFRLRNNGPMRLSLANGLIRVDNARFTGPETDIALSGTLGFTAATGYNLRAAGDVNLALASTFSTDLIASGSLHLNAALRGALDSPDVSGRVEIRNAAARYSGFTNGIDAVNASLVFNGNRATIERFTGESGGGHVDVGGFVALTGGLLAYRLDARTTGVRLRFADQVSIVSDSHITIAGTPDRSEASGTVTIHRITINPRADFSSILAHSAEPVKAPAVQAGLLSKLNLDVQIETAPDLAVETSIAQRMQADASLRLRGTATNPALLGRVNITSGELMFFGNKYTITTGSILFLNPSRIDPIVNVDLETRARGVDVILTIAGPLAKPGVSYRSDPPLQFSDIVALLATGRTPLDPGLPSGTVGQQQAFAQLGASQLIGEAIQNPASSRLQRFFGVSKVKVDPNVTDITGSPESRLTIEQQVSPDILFTYITDVSSTSTQLIRVEWAFSRNWSAIVTREENGYVGLDFAYRKRFK